MRHALLLILGLAVLVGLGGCHLGAKRLARAPERWIQEQGGIVADVDVAPRARVAWQAVTRERREPRLRLRVLAAPSLSAFAWPSGEIFLTSGLVDALDDDEITAALAHEIGHLEAEALGSAAPGFAGLASRAGSLAAEHRADLFGLDLLEARRIPGQAMVDMLRKVHARMVPGCATRAALEDRIRLLEATASR